jgi:hypothetical protein
VPLHLLCPHRLAIVHEDNRTYHRPDYLKKDGSPETDFTVRGPINQWGERSGGSGG